jgi:hypothetical protein
MMLESSAWTLCCRQSVSRHPLRRSKRWLSRSGCACGPWLKLTASPSCLRENDSCYYLDEDAIAPLFKGSRFPLTSCISGWVILHGEIAVIPEIYSDARIPHAAYRPTFVKSLAMVPVPQNKPVAACSARPKLKICQRSGWPLSNDRNFPHPLLVNTSHLHKWSLAGR